MGRMISLKAGDESFDAYLAEPDEAPRGGIVVIHEIWSLGDHTKDIADRFAREGYVALAPDLLSMTDIAKHADTLQLDLFNPEKRNEAQPKLRALMTPMQEPGVGERTLAKVKVCFDELYTRPGTGRKVAVTGFCFGGSYSFKLAAHEPRLKAAVPFYGHAPTDIDEFKQIKCPILAFYGANDEGLMGGLDEVRAMMKTAGVDFETVVYPDAGHAFFNDTNKFAYNQTAAADAWRRSLSFLKQRLD